jgi:hypothetical protein
MRRTLLEIADEMRALATTGLHYTESGFDRDRYERLMRLAARLAAVTEPESPAELEQVFRKADRGYATPKLDARLDALRGGNP